MPAFDTFRYGRNLYRGGKNPAAVYSTDRVVFENFSLSDGSVMVAQEILDSGPTRELIGGRIPRGDGEFITADYYRERHIDVKGVVVKSTAAALDAYLDTVRKDLRRREGNLDVTDSSGTAKRFTATLTNYEQ